MKAKKKLIDLITQLALILVLVVAVFVYFFVYFKEVEKRDAVHAKNRTLQVRVDELLEKEQKREAYELQMRTVEDKLRKMLSRYSAGHTPEKSILFVNEMEQQLEITIPNVSFSSPVALTAVDLSGIGTEQKWKQITFYKEPLSLSYRCDYETLKETLEYLRNYPEHRTLQSISMSYDSERGLLNGNMVIQLYTVEGGEKQYIAPKVDDVLHGRENLFAEDGAKEVPEEENRE